MKINKTNAKSAQLSPNTKSTQAIKPTSHTKAIERIEHLKSCIEKLKNAKPSERKTNEFDKGIQNARKEVDNALESLIKAIDIKYDNLVLSKRKDAKGYHYKERMCKLIMGGKVSYHKEIVKLDKNKEPIKDIFARVDARLADVYEAVGRLPKVLCDERV